MIKRKTPLKKTPLKRTSSLKKKRLTVEQIEENKLQQEKDEAFYERIWASRSHACQAHDGYKFLGYTMYKYMFDHLLEKSKYPHLRYEEKNIALVCGDCHGSKTNGHPTVKHKAMIENAKIVFEIT